MLAPCYSSIFFPNAAIQGHVEDEDHQFRVARHPSHLCIGRDVSQRGMAGRASRMDHHAADRRRHAGHPGVLPSS